MAMAVAMATAMAVIRPERAKGAWTHENSLFRNKHRFDAILIIFDPSRPQKVDPAGSFALEKAAGGPET